LTAIRLGGKVPRHEVVTLAGGQRRNLRQKNWKSTIWKGGGDSEGKKGTTHAALKSRFNTGTNAPTSAH